MAADRWWSRFDADDLKWSAAGAQITDFEFLSCLVTPLENALPGSESSHFRKALQVSSADCFWSGSE